MTKINPVTFLLLVIFLFFSACGTTNHIGFFTKKINGLAMVREKKNKKEIVKISTIVQKDKSKKLILPDREISFINSKTAELYSLPTTENILAFKELKNIMLINKIVLPNNSFGSYKKFNFFETTSSISKEKNSKIFDSNQSSGGNRLVISSVVLLALGLLILFFASIILGAVLMFLGLIFLIIALAVGTGGGSSGAKNDKYKQEYQDVVYLKNGGILRGMIIEQIPNVQLKIQTKDGSVFVYKMDEIEKITKELSKYF